MNQFRVNVIKIGGSVITEKSAYRSIREENLVEICKQMSNLGSPYIIIHGAGSFGHIIAEKHSIQTGFEESSQLSGVVKIRQDMATLTQKVVSNLVENNVKAIGFQTSALAFMEGTEVQYCLNPIEKSLSLGLFPVLSGDVIFAKEEGFTIHSGDSIINHLVKKFDVNQVIFLTDVDGLIEKTDDEEDGKLVKSMGLEEFKNFKAKEMRSDVIDVTGSMSGKIDEIADILNDVEQVIILNGLFPERLKQVLENEDVISTTIFGEKSTQR